MHRFSTSSGGKRRIEPRHHELRRPPSLPAAPSLSCSSLSQRAGDFFQLQMFVEAKLNLALLFEISFKEAAVINGQSQPFGRRWQQLMPLWLLKNRTQACRAELNGWSIKVRVRQPRSFIPFEPLINAQTCNLLGLKGAPRSLCRCPHQSTLLGAALTAPHSSVCPSASRR